MDKRYEEALERAKAGKPLDEVFHELKEIEDERIRKELIEYLTHRAEVTGFVDEDKDCKRWIAYLERQKEQKILPGFDELTPDEEMSHPLYLKGFDAGRKVQTVFDEQKPAHTAKEMWKEMRRSVLEQTCGNCHEPNYADDSTKMFSLCDIDEIFEEIGNSTVEPHPAEWSEEDEEMLDAMIDIVSNSLYEPLCPREGMLAWLKALRSQPKEERKPMKIKYGGKIYQVHGVRDLPGGSTGYIIEDEPGHYDCIINPEEVLGGGYGVKQNGSPYPTKEATFDSPHWKPSKEQMDALKYALGKGGCYNKEALDSLLTDLKKLL